MASVTFQEFSGMGVDVNGNVVQAAKHPILAKDTVTYTTSTACDNVFTSKTRVLRICPSATLYYECGKSPTATAESCRLVADQIEYVVVEPGHKIAFYDGTS